MKNISTIRIGNAVGIVGVVFFLLCVFWGVLLIDPNLKELHVNIMQISFPGFSFSLLGVIIGLIESYIYGFIFGAFFMWLCKKTCM